MNHLRLQGDGAQILWGYQIAVTVSAWTLRMEPGPAESPAPPPGPWVFDGTVVTCQVVAARQQPLTLVIPRQPRSWRWPIRSLTITNGQVVAQLGPKEESSYVPVRAAGNGQAGSERR